MDTWTQDPRNFLVMYLKLRTGVHFHNSTGNIQTSLPDVLEPTDIDAWQYRLMMGLDGEEQFLAIVKDVKDNFKGEFSAEEVWSFLYWMLENELIENAQTDNAELDGEIEDEELILFPEIEPVNSPVNAWVKMPLQIVAIFIICICSMYTAYVATPYAMAYLNQGKPSQTEDPIAEIEAAAVQIQATRTPDEVAVVVEKELAGRQLIKPIEPTQLSVMPDAEVDPSVEESKKLLKRLMGLREQMAACQIRRDEYYLLNDEDGYSREVERIAALAHEIGEASAEVAK